MPKRKPQRKDKSIPTLDDVVLKKTSSEADAITPPVTKKPKQQIPSTKEKTPEPANTKTKADKEPQAETPAATNKQASTENSTADTQPDAQADTPDMSRRVEDRRVEDVPLGPEEPDRRSSQRRRAGSRSSDRNINAQLHPLIEKILKEMIPDLEEHIETQLGNSMKHIVAGIMPALQQHMRMQLRFEIDKHMSKILKEGLEPDDED